METLGLALIVGLLFVKEAGVPVPVPGDLVVLGAGIGASQGRFDPVVAGIAIVAATIAGGIVQFALLRGPGRRVMLGIARRVGISQARIDGLADRLRRRGATAVAVARMTPGVRILAIPGAAVAALPFGRFIAGLSGGNAVFTGGHFALGLALGAAAPATAAGLVPVALGLVAFAVAGVAGWRLLSHRRARNRGDVIEAEREAAADWTDACCPACLVIAWEGRSRDTLAVTPGGKYSGHGSPHRSAPAAFERADPKRPGRR